MATLVECKPQAAGHTAATTEGVALLPAHFPSNPDRFTFDEVTPFFQSMAERSIPDYERAHAMHTRMLRPWMMQPGVKVLDAGASRGRFLEHLLAVYGYQRLVDGDMKLTAMDVSPTMCDALREAYPEVQVIVQDLAADTFLYGQGVEKYDVICCFYVLQFIHPSAQGNVLRRLMAMLKTGGVLVLGQKSTSGGVLGHLAHEHYIEWRKHNGYTQAEITAKTVALAGSMWPMDHSEVLQILREQMREIMETTRTGVFNTLVARK